MLLAVVYTVARFTPGTQTFNRAGRLTEYDRRSFQVVTCPTSSAMMTVGRRGRRRARCPGAGRIPAANQEREFMSRVRRLTVEGRRAGEALVTRWTAPGVPERARSGEPVLPDLRARLRDRRDQAHLAGHGQDDLLLLPARDRSILFASTHHDPKSKQYRTRARLPRLGQGAPLRLGLRPGDGNLRVRGEERRADPADQRARLRRRGRLLPRRTMDCVLVDARRLQPHALATGAEAARDGPELLRRDLHHEGGRLGPEAPHQRRPATTAGRSSPPTASASSGGGSTSRA